MPALPGVASSGGELAGSGLVVELAGGSKGAEVFPGCGFGGAELAGELAMGEEAAASLRAIRAAWAARRRLKLVKWRKELAR